MYSESPWHRGTFAASAVDPTRTFLATRGTRGSGRVSPWLGPTLECYGMLRATAQTQRCHNGGKMIIGRDISPLISPVMDAS
jgi:hypothetical protein